MLYRIVNQAKAAKQSDDVDSLINHEKQGKTFTQVNEKVMPNIGRKVSANKVTLPNMMRQEENEPFDKPFKNIARTPEKDTSRAKQLAKKAEKEAGKKAKAKKK